MPEVPCQSPTGTGPRASILVHTLQPLTLAHIAGRLEALHIRAPRGGNKWSICSVQNDRIQRWLVVTPDIHLVIIG